MKKFGIEIEFVTSAAGANQIASALTEAGVPTSYEGYTHRRMATWKLVTDASLPGGLELVSPPMTLEGLGSLRTACNTLEELGCSVNSRCGLHVHIDASDMTPERVKNIIFTYSRNQQLINSILPPSRRNSRWAGPITSERLNLLSQASTFTDIRRTLGYNRYWAINVEAYMVHGTIEFRQHSGTMSPVKIENWIRLLLAISETTQAHPAYSNLRQFLSSFFARRQVEKIKRTIYTATPRRAGKCRNIHRIAENLHRDGCSRRHIIRYLIDAGYAEGTVRVQVSRFYKGIEEIEEDVEVDDPSAIDTTRITFFENRAALLAA